MNKRLETIYHRVADGHLSKLEALQQIEVLSAAEGRLHPLLHAEVEGQEKRLYRSHFEGTEFFLRDHRLHGRRILPGAAYLEMARAAAEHAWRGGSEGQDSAVQKDAEITCLENVIWAQPIEVDGDGRDILVELAADVDGSAQFEIYSLPEGAERRVYSQGGVATEIRAEPERVALQDLRTQYIERHTGDACYVRFRTMGMDYGPSHQVVHELLVGGGWVLAKIELPTSLHASAAQYVLHPSLIDGALQSGIGLAWQDQDRELAIPFGLDSLKVYRPCPQQMWAWVRPTKAGRLPGMVQKYDVELCGPDGFVCAQLRGFSVRWVQKSNGTARTEPETLFFQPTWRPAEQAETDKGTGFARHDVFLVGSPGEPVEAGETGAVWKTLRASSSVLSESLESDLAQVFQTVKVRLERNPRADLMTQVIYEDSGELKLYSALAGLFRTARRENPRFHGQVIRVPALSKVDLPHVARRCCQLAQHTEIRIQSGRAEVVRWQEAALDVADRIPWKEHGVYLITGGSGALGFEFALDIARCLNNVALILVGRSAAAELQQEQLARLRSLGAEALYCQVDLTCAQSTADLVESILSEFGRLDGVLHSAGVVHDNIILKKSTDEFRKVLGPKVSGTLNLDASTSSLALDVFIMFSSAGASMGNVGQADYATANGFLDSFAVYRQELVEAGRRQGRTLSVGWPLWKDGGMGVDRTTLKLMEDSGLTPIDTPGGVAALYRSLCSDGARVLVLQGEPLQIAERLEEREAQSSPSEQDAPASTSESFPSGHEGKVLAYLKEQLAEALKLSPTSLKGKASFESFGIDSIMVMQLTNRLEKIFGVLPKTLFYEYQNLSGLVEYFIAEHPGKLRSLLKMDDGVSPVPPEVAAWQGGEKAWLPVQPQGNGPLDIAIVGLAGRYPQALDLDAYWDNLASGRDCITEIPRDRWEWQRFYTADRDAKRGHYSKWGGFIAGVDQFDPLFFGISPREAEYMDPQERLFLEHSWMALEDAGYGPSRLAAGAEAKGEASPMVGVYAGVMYSEYVLYSAEATARGEQPSTGGSYGSIANRVSYVLNLQGPSMTIDTMCSSSLTCIHLACQELALGRIGLAIAGGVNVSIHPHKYAMLSKGKFISSAGRCESFGEGGNGYIPGEGVGVLILKRLTEAEEDGDQIYGVIKGSSINHGGKTHGYSVPNPNAQSRVIAQALEQAQVHPTQVSYVEAHGTGTKLGDPIEIAGLSRAFQLAADSQPICFIGSAKSNIGHCESAAGIAGLTKVLLQMRHRQIAPSIHSEVLNPNLDLSSTPFVVNQELRPWDAPQVDGISMPRVAGISSFGAGGSNAHLVVEEYPAGNGLHVEEGRPAHLIVLSAKKSESLREYAGRLADFLAARIEAEEGPERLYLADVAFTLLSGREAMRERLALVASSLSQLKDGLRGFLAGENGSFHRGRATDEEVEVARPDPQTVERWIGERAYEELAAYWVEGGEVDGALLHRDRGARRVRLPTYPFARRRYWMDDSLSSRLRPPEPAAFVRPDPWASELFYETRFTGDERFLRDHLVQGKKVLPGVVYLEMARAAFHRAMVPGDGETSCIRLQDVMWPHRLTVDQEPVEAEIRLQASSHDLRRFEIASKGGDGKALHCRGLVGFAPPPGLLAPDLDALRSRLTCPGPDASNCYAFFEGMGLVYGPSHQGIEALFVDGPVPTQVLARLALGQEPGPAAGRGIKASEFVLDPGLMDAALQASIGLLPLADRASTPLRLPFAIDAVEIRRELRGSAWVWLRGAETDDGDAGLDTLDLDLFDEDGRLCVTVRGLTFRTAPTGTAAASPPGVGLLMAEPVWEEQEIEASAGVLAYDERVVLLCDVEPGEGDSTDGGPWQYIGSVDSALAPRFAEIAWKVFSRVKDLILENRPGRTLVQVVTRGSGSDALLAALAALLKVAQAESSRVSGQLIEIVADSDLQHLARILEQNAKTDDDHVRYEDGKRRIPVWIELPTGRTEALPWRQEGVYLITGGLGGLGRIFADAVARRAAAGNIVLTGRSALDGAAARVLDILGSHGAHVVYRQVDVCDRRQVEDLMTFIEETFGSLHGILHSAGVRRDRYIRQKTHQDFVEVFAPKVTGTLHLDAASQHHELDFFVLFSSGSAVTGNLGQADYAAANAWMDRYAQLRRRGQVQGLEGQRRFLSINWPLWKDGGMTVDAATETMWRRAMGLIPMSATSGVDALERALTAERPQVLVVEGILQELRQKLRVRQVDADAVVHPEASSGEIPAATPPNVTGTGDTAIRLQGELIRAAAEILRVDVQDFDPDEELSDYGFDSITLTEFSNALNETFGFHLVPTVFFDYLTISDLADYLQEAYPQAIATQYGAPAQKAAQADSAGRDVASPVFEGAREPEHSSPASVSVPGPRSGPLPEGKDEPVAIVGMVGTFPMAGDLEEFWRQLEDGKDCITEVPRWRWDWQKTWDDLGSESRLRGLRWGGFIDQVDAFDSLFFEISPREAELMDPQQRLLMEYAWRVIEDAGYSPADLSGSDTGIFVGTANSGYSSVVAKAQIPLDGYSATGQVPSVGPNRLSYWLDLHGPSEPVETACSSSLVALHRAIGCLRRGECGMALAGGINTIPSPDGHVSFAKAGMLSEDGRCQTFSAEANGYVRSEGVGMLLLKSLSAAERDRDQIYALIRGSAQNHGGRTANLTAPNPRAQAALLSKAYRNAGVDPRTVGYIEAHGTGTSLGDPIEVEGLKLAFQELSEDHGAGSLAAASIALGSVKTNIGHAELAAGVAGVVKVVLQLRHRKIAKSLHSDALNPYLKLQDTPFYIPQETEPWQALDDAQGRLLPRRAGVSSFGFGGVNAHLILEEYVPSAKAPEPAEGRPAVILVSARTEDRLREQVANLLSYVQRHGEQLSLQDMAYTLAIGRQAMEERLGLVVGSMDELQKRLRSFLESGDATAGVDRGNGRAPRAFLGLLADDDEDLNQVFSAWLAKGKYSKLVSAWVLGQRIDWNPMFEALGRSPRRISLPTYAFARERHWAGRGLAERSIAERTMAESSPVSETRRDPILTGPTSIPISSAEGGDREADASKIARLRRHVEQLDFDGWPARLLLSQLQRLGILERPGPGSEDALRQRARIVDKYERWWRESCVGILESSGYLDVGTEGISLREGMSVETPDDVWSAWDRWRAPVREDAELQGTVDLLDGCLRHLPEILTGSVEATEIVFAGSAISSAVEQLEAVYRKNSLADHFGHHLATAATRFIRQRLEARPGRPLRLLEIGAGTGSTTATLLPELDAFRSHISEYCYTDVSKAFLLLGEERFARDYPFLKFELWNVEEPFGGGTYDIVLAANVLHATRNIRQSLRNIHDMLSADGLLLLDEHTEKSILATLTFGLLDGWWLFEDESLRIPGSPLLSPEGWTSVLAESGYQAIEFPPATFAVPKRDIIVARRGEVGVVGTTRARSSLDFGPLERRPEVEGPARRVDGSEEDVNQIVQGTVAEVLKLRSIDSARPLAEAGLDSISAVVLASRLEKRLQRTIQPRWFVDYPTVEALCRFLGAGETRGVRETPKEETRQMSPALQEQVLDTVAEVLQIRQVDPSRPLSELGLDSISAVVLASRMEKGLGRSVQPRWFVDYPTVESLCSFLGEAENRARQETSLAESGEAPRRPEPDAVPQTNPPPLGRTRRGDDLGKAPPDMERIAVIGISGTFPQCHSVPAFWNALERHQRLLERIPKQRFDPAECFEGERQRGEAEISQWGGFIPDLDAFDAELFDIAPTAAGVMDPRQRLLLMSTYHTLQDAGYAPKSIRGSDTGVFIAGEANEYWQLLRQSDLGFADQFGHLDSMLANRLSYTLDLHGPSEFVNTMCSGGAIALHRAVTALRSGQMRMAIVGAANLILRPEPFIALSSSGQLSPTDRVESFGAGASGYLRSEGVATVLLKPLSLAQRDGDPIYLTIRHSATGSNGLGGISITAPSQTAHAQLIESCYREAGVSARDIGYIEAQGMGNSLADIVEWGAMNAALASLAQKQDVELPPGNCTVSTLKPMIGHMHSVSALGALFKVIQSLRTDRIYPILGLRETHPELDLVDQPCVLANEPVAWVRGEVPRLAGVHSFGGGGNNAHLLLEEYLNPQAGSPRPKSSSREFLFIFSAPSMVDLRRLLRQMLTYLEANSQVDAGSLASTLQLAWDPMAVRVAWLFPSLEGLMAALSQHLEEEAVPSVTDPALQPLTPDGPHHSESTWRHELDHLYEVHDLHRLARCWLAGGDVDWTRVNTKVGGVADPHLPPLPGYPFKKDRYWLPDTDRDLEQTADRRAASPPLLAPSLVRATVARAFGDLVGRQPNALELERPLMDYGFDSLMRVQLKQQLERDLQRAVPLADLSHCTSMVEVCALLESLESRPGASQEMSRLAGGSLDRFRELVRLNEVRHGRPVFWIHGGGGGVEVYRVVAAACARPFWGIQARGWMSHRTPLPGIPAMAAYYVQVIQAVQPKGPYDLGGYSLGGMLAYEVTRQLQDLGEEVASVVMLDTFDFEHMRMAKSTRKGEYLTAVNLALLMLPAAVESTWRDLFIPHRALESNLDDEEYLQRLVALGVERGLNKSESQVRTMLEQLVAVRHAADIDGYQVLPLPAPDRVQCYYFRNGSGLTLGDLREYFATPECEVPPDHVVYWQAWEREFEQFHVVDVDCHNHVLMLTEDVPRQAIVPACARLYAVEGEAPSLKSGRDVQPRNTDSLEREPLST